MLDIEKLINLIDAITFVQGFIFGLIFIFLSKKDKSTVFLGMFLLSFNFDGCKDVLNEIFITPPNFNYELLPTIFIFLALPLFYLYAKQVSVLKNVQQNYWILVPGIIEFITLFVLFILGVDYEDSLSFALYFLLGVVFNIYIAIKIIRFAKKHLKLVENQYTSIAGLQLYWVKQYTITLLVYLAAIFLLIGFDFPYAELIISIFNLILVYWVVYKGFQQQNVELLMEPEDFENDVLEAVKDQNSDCDFEEMKIIIDKVDDYLKETKSFRQEDLTIIDVSKGIKISSKKVSRAINLVKETNFNVYINRLRIEEAVRYLKNSNYDSFSIEGIGLEAGFKSKSAFYNAFKKEKNCTPLELRKNNSGK